MYISNTLPDHGLALDPADAATLGPVATDRVAQVLALRRGAKPTPLVALPGLAQALGIETLHLKDEGFRLGLGSFKALGGAYALMILVKEEAERQLRRTVEIAELTSARVREIAAGMVFACATDGNHGRSVAQGAQAMGATAKIFVHSGVSAARIDAIAAFGAQIVRVKGNYDDSVAEAARVAHANGWTILSDTSWPGYEYIPGLVLQGYTIMVREILEKLDASPTHVFLQAGVGGFAAAIAGSLAITLGDARPRVIIVEPTRAACLYESARIGKVTKVSETEPTVMAMLECFEPSILAFRVLARVADVFMKIEDSRAVEMMRRLASPVGGDPAVVAGESGGAGLAGLIASIENAGLAQTLDLGPQSRVLVINTEGATDPAIYEKIVGRAPSAVRKEG